MNDCIDQIRTLAAAAAPDMVELRRDLHAHPEVAWQEHKTTVLVADALASYGLTPAIRAEGTGLVTTIRNGSEPVPGERIVGFRADLDALPIAEETSVSFRSTVEGVMHACGHDIHTAVGVGIARVLSQMEIPGAVQMIFQPAEEQIPGGATRMVNEGIVEDLAAIAAFHVDPSLPAGSIGLRKGPITAAADRIEVTLHGPGGHTSRPYQTVNLVAVAAQLVTELPVRIKQAIDPSETIAVVFGKIEGGGAANVIPTTVLAAGTVRLFNAELWRTMPELVERCIRDIVEPLGAKVELAYHRGSPPTDNASTVIDAFSSAGESLLGTEAVREAHQSLGSEDFAWFLESAPGALIRLGCAADGVEVDLHSATFEADDACIEHGIAVGAAALIELLEG